MAGSAYLKDPADIITISGYLDEIDVEGLGTSASASFTSLYETLTAAVGPELAKSYYEQGYSDYRQEKFAIAIPNLAKAYQYDETNGDALFYLANSYRRNGNINKAKEAYVEVIDKFPGTEKANRSEVYLTEINNANPQ